MSMGMNRAFPALRIWNGSKTPEVIKANRRGVIESDDPNLNGYVLAKRTQAIDPSKERLCWDETYVEKLAEPETLRNFIQGVENTADAFGQPIKQRQAASV